MGKKTKTNGYSGFEFFKDVIMMSDNLKPEKTSKRRTVKKKLPEPEQWVQKRLAQLEQHGIQARLIYEPLTKTYTIGFKLELGQEVPEWR